MKLKICPSCLKIYGMQATKCDSDHYRGIPVDLEIYDENKKFWDDDEDEEYDDSD